MSLYCVSKRQTLPCLRDVFPVERGKINTVAPREVLYSSSGLCLANGGLLISWKYEKGLEGTESLHAVFKIFSVKAASKYDFLFYCFFL